MHSQEARPLQQLRPGVAIRFGGAPERMNGLRTRRLGLIISLIVVLVVTLELAGRLDRLITGHRRRIADGAGHEPADTVTERGDVLARKSWPAALGGAPTEHAEEIDHPRLLAFRDDPARVRAICRTGLSMSRCSMSEGMSHAQ